jgi:PAS domain S-box-containing protein
VDVNGAFTELTGFTREEAIGKSAVDLGFISSETRDEIGRQIEAHGRVDHFEVEVDTKFGSRTVLFSACVVDLESGPHNLVSAADITARKRAKDAVEARLAFEETVSSVARALAELPWDRLHIGFDKALKQIGQYLGVDVCGLNQVSAGRETCRVTK